MEVTHIVSGYMRSGTSMMVEALEAGGMCADYDNSREFDFELRRDQYKDVGFPAKHRGRLIKVLWRALAMIAPMDYRVVFMKRHPGAIAESYVRRFNRKPPPSTLTDYYEEVMDISIGIARQRRDVRNVVVMQYEDVIRSPEQEFRRLLNAGWSFDIDKAVKTIDPARCHQTAKERRTAYV